MARAVVASLLVGAALAQSPHSSPAFCLPEQWSGGYTRTSDTSGATGNVTHSYLDQFFAIEENALGVGRNGSFEPYNAHYIQNGTHTWVGIRWSSGQMNCYKSNNANPAYDKNCFDHGGHTKFHMNGRPAKSAYNVFYPTNKSQATELEVIVVSALHPNLPVQSWSWDANSQHRRSPNYVMIHNPKLGFNEKIAKLPAVCNHAEVEEGPAADEAAKFFAKRAALKSEAGHWVHPKAVKAAPVPENPLFAGYAEVEQTRSCVPNAYHSHFYYMDDNFTVTGAVAHNFAQKEFGVMENITGLGINGTVRTRYVQKGNNAWAITESMNGTMTKCSSAPVLSQYNQRCRMGYTRNVVVNGHPATETHIADNSGSNTVYSAIFQSKPSGLPISVFNLTQATSGPNGDPKSIAFFNVKFGANHRIFNVPSICNTDAEAVAEVEAAANKYRHHLLTM